MRFIYVFIVFLTCVSVYSQKEDNVWLFGSLIGDNGDPSWLADTTWGATNIDFNYNPPKIYYDSTRVIDFGGTNASICDTVGELFLFSNGQAIFDVEGNFIEDTINYGTLWEDFSLYFNDTLVYTGLPFIQSSLILPLYQSSEYYVFNQFFDDFDFTNFLTYSIITNSLGEITVLDKDLSLPLEAEISVGILNAVRHGNGRDWWVICGGKQNGTYYVLLLNEEGIIDQMEFSFSNDDNRTNGVGQMYVSSDGTKIGLVNGHFNTSENGAFVAFMDFDRCSGQLTKFVYEQISTYGAGPGFSFSQDGSKAYVSNTNFIYQYDLTKSNIISSREEVAEYDEFLYYYLPDTTFGFSTAFGYMGLAPDGKIYISSASASNRLLSRIESPNLTGVECDVNQHGIALPTSYKRTMPNFPNYRLGPLDGSVCDTLNIDNVPVAKFRCEQDTGNVLNYEFVDLSYFEPEIWEYSINGETVNEQNFSYEFPSSGEYEICLEVSNENGKDTYCKTIVIGLINSVSKEEIDYSTMINIYPNPFKDILTMSFHDYFPVESYYKCYTVGGQLVSEGLLKSNWNTVDLGSLAKGKYFIVFYESGKVIGSKFIVKLE